MKRIMFILAALLATLLLLSSCDNNNASPIPEEGTAVTNIVDAPVFVQAAKDLEGDCEAIGGCTCFLDGIQTTCSLVFACLDAGFCEVVARE